jgi:uncharacterized phage protein (TIGR01671 family)
MKNYKFRAWDKKNKKMTDEFDFTDFDGDYFAANDIYLSDMEIMQYIGIEDKNGKEIYEGDIIVYKDFNDEQKLKKIISLQEFFEEKGYAENEFGEDWENNIIVIGNIYENPELLNKC